MMPQWKCPNCGNTTPAQGEEDGKCTVCGRRMEIHGDAELFEDRIPTCIYPETLLVIVAGAVNCPCALQFSDIHRLVQRLEAKLDTEKVIFDWTRDAVVTVIQRYPDMFKKQDETLTLTGEAGKVASDSKLSWPFVTGLEKRVVLPLVKEVGAWAAEQGLAGRKKRSCPHDDVYWGSTGNPADAEPLPRTFFCKECGSAIGIEGDEWCKTIEEDDAFQDELKDLLNRHSRENRSDTPDHILATYMKSCLEAFETATGERTRWFAPKSKDSE